MPVGVNSVDLILNELSIDEQFYDVASFRVAIDRVMRMRSTARKFGREVYCRRTTVNRMANPTTSFLQMIFRTFSDHEISAIRGWLTKHGPFSEEHDPNCWFDCNGELVSDSALAEAAYCLFAGIEKRGVVSLIPSNWEYSPLLVTLGEGFPQSIIELDNFWDPVKLEAALQVTEPPVKSWFELEEVCRRRFQKLIFSEDSFRDMDGRPFAIASANRIASRLDVLDRLVGLSGLQTLEGRQLYGQHFIGDRAWFSDSSDTEKRTFRRALTFQNPMDKSQELFCTWHGKINTPPYRIHFSWPITPSGQIYVVYIGWKITTQ